MLKRHTLLSLAILGLYAAAAESVETREIVSTLQDQQQLAVTIYNDNLAMVKDQRKLTLGTGQTILSLRDISAQMRPESVLLHSRNAPGSLSIQEQNFDFDLLTPEKLLEKYTGKTVTIIRTNPATGVETSEQAKVLSTNNGVVLKVGNRIETGIPGRIVYDEMPANLHDRPTLVTQLTNNGPANQELELSYLTTGLSWKADYVAELNSAENKLDLSAWASLSNTSGTRYLGAKVQLVAGDVNMVRDQPAALDMRMKTMQMAEAQPMAEESLSEYHVYTLDRPITLADNQTKQVSMLAANGVPVHKEFLVQGANYYYQAAQSDLEQKLKVAVQLEFDNKVNVHLGMPLPKGIIRVYQKDKAGTAHFIGEDRLDHTPKNDTVKVKLGNAFDVAAARKQTEFKRLPNPDKGSSLFESAYEITIRNAKKEAINVTVQEPIPGDWRILRSSHPFEKGSSSMALWHIQVPAEGQTTLAYRVQVKY
ncbi:MAG TPA: DUF4139 domain-containing protein [Methylophilaceae bacterium]|nr:DUF4139 domain-containing protein [Methylophilaceae bacterium]